MIISILVSPTGTYRITGPGALRDTGFTIVKSNYTYNPSPITLSRTRVGQRFLAISTIGYTLKIDDKVARSYGINLPSVPYLIKGAAALDDRGMTMPQGNLTITGLPADLTKTGTAVKALISTNLTVSSPQIISGSAPKKLILASGSYSIRHRRQFILTTG